MSFYNGILNHDDIHASGQIGQRGLPGVGFKLDSNGNYDIENKKITNVKPGTNNDDVVIKSQIQYLDGVLPSKVTPNKAVIYSPSGSVHTNDLYLKDKYSQEVHFISEDQDDNQIRLYIPNLKNNDSFGGRLKSSIMITSIDQTIEGKKIFNDITVPNPSKDNQPATKMYVDGEISKISGASDNSDYVKKTGDTMIGPLIIPKDSFPIQGDLNKVISYETQREIFLSKREGGKMEQPIDMNGFSIDNLPLPTADDSACSKGYVNSNFLNRLIGGQIGGDIDMRGHSIKYLKLDNTDHSAARVAEMNLKLDRSGGTISGDLVLQKKYQYPITGDLKKIINYENIREIFLSRKESFPMNIDLNMNNHLIQNVKDPVNVDNGANKRYVDDTITKSSNKPSHTTKNAFQYLMGDVNEWSSEYNVRVFGYSNLVESPHYWNKAALSIAPLKDDDNNYRFRLGLQMFPLKTNDTYTLMIELLNHDYITWQRQQTYVEGTGIWLKSHNTNKFQHRYGSSGVLYYSKTLVKFKKTSDSAPVFLYFTVHFDNRKGDMNTYPKEFSSQVYIAAYGVLGETDHIDSEVYDQHKAFEIDKNKMKMLVPLDMDNNAITNVSAIDMNNGSITNIGPLNMNNKAIMNVKTPLSNLDAANKLYVDDSIKPFEKPTRIYMHGMVDRNKIFTISSMQLSGVNLEILYIRFNISTKYKGMSDSINIKSAGLSSVSRYSFNFSSSVGFVIININRYFNFIEKINMDNAKNIPFQVVYKVFYTSPYA